MSKIQSRGYSPAPTTADEKQYFFEQLPNLIELAETILADRKLFETLPGAFAYTSWPYISGDGPLCLGHLLLGWRDGILAETCSKCGCIVFVYCFAGSPLSGRNSFSGYCSECQAELQARSDGKRFIERMKFVLRMRSTAGPYYGLHTPPNYRMLKLGTTGGR